jgi:GntR family transcriptional regulator, transcriptional repressor for pyruvate dehydrogenase complex
MGYHVREIMFARLKDKRLFERIVDQIKEKIISGELNVGDKLPSEAEMTQIFGVSRSAVREALRTLELSGLVAVKQGNRGGCFIQEVNNNRKLVDYISDQWGLGNVTFADLAEARSGLESVVIGIVGQKGTEKDFALLRKSIDNAERMYKEKKEIEKIDEQFDFHIMLAQITRNRVLIDMLAAIIDLLRYMMIKIKPTKEITLKTFEDHRKIVEFLEAGKVEKAKEISSAHIFGINKRLGRKYAKQRGLSSSQGQEPSGAQEVQNETGFDRIIK